MATTAQSNEVTKLAIRGGTPIRGSWLPYGRQNIDEADIEAVVKCLKSDWLTQGPKIAEFEQAVAEASGMQHAVAVSNGTAALHAAYFAVGLGEGDEIVMPGMSFAATANAALYLGAKPVFADIHPDHGNIMVSSARAAITTKTKAIVAVDFAGRPCQMTELRSLADEHKLPLIIDGAHSLGARYHGKRPAQLADLTTYSFHPVKSITTGEGGMIVTDSQQFADRMRIFRTHGIEKSSEKFEFENQGPWYHEMQELGFNYRMTDFQAALGASQMRRLNQFVCRRQEIAKRYREKLATLEHFTCLAEEQGVESAYHLFPVLVNKTPYAETRKFAVEALHAENIGVQIHYLPIYSHPYYRKSVCPTAPKCPNTDTFYERVFSLPMFPSMTDADIADVIEALRKLNRAFEAESA